MLKYLKKKANKLINFNKKNIFIFKNIILFKFNKLILFINIFKIKYNKTLMLINGFKKKYYNFINSLIRYIFMRIIFLYGRIL